MKANVKSITISNAEGKTEYCNTLPKTFGSFQEANQFFQNNAYQYAKGGYDKHDVKVVWEEGSEYAYRADMSHPEGNCFSSLEYNIGQRIKQALCYRIVCDHENEETKATCAKMLEELKTSEMSPKELEALVARDSKIANANSEKQKRERYAVEFETLKKELVDTTKLNMRGAVEVDNGFINMEAYYKKNTYVVFSGETNKVNPSNNESELVKFRQVFKVGDSARVYSYGGYDTGKIVSITDKNVIIELKNTYKSGRKRVSHTSFIGSNNNSGRYIESIEYQASMMEVYSR